MNQTLNFELFLISKKFRKNFRKVSELRKGVKKALVKFPRLKKWLKKILNLKRCFNKIMFKKILELKKFWKSILEKFLSSKKVLKTVVGYIQSHIMAIIRPNFEKISLTFSDLPRGVWAFKRLIGVEVREKIFRCN